MDRDAGDLAGGVEARDRSGAVDVGLDAAHDVVLAGADHDRLARDVDAREVPADVDDLAQRLQRALARDRRDVEPDAVAVGADAASLEDLGLLGTRDDVAGGELHLVGCVALHEALALGVEQTAPSPRAPSVIKRPFSGRVVGWYWTISMSISGAPMR